MRQPRSECRRLSRLFERGIGAVKSGSATFLPVALISGRQSKSSELSVVQNHLIGLIHLQVSVKMLSRSNSLMDEDAGIMSEAETSATGFRRGSKPRSSLPVVRTPSKTLERPLGEEKDGLLT